MSFSRQFHSVALPGRGIHPLLNVLSRNLSLDVPKLCYYNHLSPHPQAHNHVWNLQ